MEISFMTSMDYLNDRRYVRADRYPARVRWRSTISRAGGWLGFVSLILRPFLARTHIGNAMTTPLKDRFPPWDAARGAPDGVIVLGGTIDAWGPRNQRLLVVPEMLRRYPNARVLFS